MRLKHLELQGYKTFAAKTEFAFNEGITAIVGPNGSGKSNIADAVRWVLGEQSYSVLRAKRTEDMIFWGSERRSRQGMAQASITLDNSDGWLPVEYSEVTISRRAYRSGENEYLLNGNRVRLKDITELLGKSRLGRQSYTVIGQGLVDVVLSLRPDERRAIFEEAAGISIHQAKRTNAIDKLQQTRDNILRVNDLVNEIAPQLKRLEKQAERAQHREELSEQLEELLRTWYTYSWQRAQTALRQAEAKAEKQEELSREREAELEELERRKAELRAQQSQLRQKLSDGHLKETNLQAQAEGKKRELAVSQERLRMLGQQSQDIAEEIASLEANRTVQLERVAEAQEELNQAETQLQERLIHLPEAQEKLEVRKREQQAILKELTGAQDRSFQLATEAADRRNRLIQLSERREELGQEVEEHRKTLADHQAKLTALQEQIEALKGELEAIQAEADSLTTQRREVEQESEASRQRQAQLQAALAKSEQEETQLHARYDLLERMRQEESSYYTGAETVLQAARDGRLTGIVSPVASLMQIPPDLETAIEAALGPHLHDIVVETLADAEAAIHFLKRTKGGRATFLPLDRIRPIQKPIPPVTAVKGVIGLAVDLVRFERGLVGLGYNLLSGTIIVRDFQTALRLVTYLGTRSPFQTVTLTGEVITSDGAVTGGPTQGRGRGILSRERERHELPQHLAEAQKRCSDLEKERHTEEAVQRHLLEKLATFDKKEGEIKAKEDVKLEELASQERQAELLDQERGWRRAIEDQLKAETRALDDKEALLTEELDGLEEEEAKTEGQFLALEARLDTLSVEELEYELAELKTAVAVAEQGCENQRNVLQNLKADLIRLDEQVSAKNVKEEQLTAESRDLITRVDDLQLGYRELMDQVQAMAELIEPAEAELAALDSEQVEIEKTEVRLRPLLREYESLKGQAVLEVERRKDELTSLMHQVENDLSLVEMETDDYVTHQQPLTLESLVSTLPPIEELPHGLEEEIGRLKAQTKHIGPVNPNAPAEYKEVLERYNFLTAQAEDLEEATKDLRQVIGELDELMERDFREVFETVRRGFNEYFVSLFGGGAAELVLTEPDDLMETGVDIVTRPPGRRRQSLALLSGGERALTAVALIFAILKASPTPFCFLDEVDATLDETNIGRFREGLQELSDRTQFIVITHNRGTVEAADTIYGISMGKDSVSRVISLKLGDGGSDQ
ncbi:MAG: chromosome segregation protein SMC [Anaerolineae bacterium]